MNLPITEIMKHTGLSEEEIQKLKYIIRKPLRITHLADSKRLFFRIVSRQPHQEFLQARYPVMLVKRPCSTTPVIPLIFFSKCDWVFNWIDIQVDNVVLAVG